MNSLLQIWEDVVQPAPAIVINPGGLLQQSDLVYQGCFRTPATGNYTFSPKGLAYNPVHDSLYIVGFEFDHTVAEISIPAPIKNAPNQASLNQAVTLQPLIDPTEGSIGLVSGGDRTALGGVLVYGNRLIVTAYRYYDANGTQPATHWARNPNLSATGDYVGPVVVDAGDLGLRAGLVSGYMGAIPPEWQAAFGGYPCFTGNCGLSIIGRTSFGPGAFAFNPDDIGAVSPVPSQALVYYPQDHQTLGWYDIAAHPGAPNPNLIFNGTMQMGGIVFPNGTQSVLFFGMLGQGLFRYGQGTSDPALDGMVVPGEEPTIYCYDPASPAKGEHAYPYLPYVWAYDAMDFAAVVAGTKEPWEIVPYAVWALTGDFSPANQLGRYGGATYDPATGRIFAFQQFGNVFDPLVHVWTITAASPTYVLTVVNGLGSGSYAAGAVINIIANTAAAGFVFDKWTGDVSTVADINAATTTITMPAAPATITATYAALPTYVLTVTNGTGDGTYLAGTVVHIVADAPGGGSVFDRWTGSAAVTNIFAASTTITMPAAPTTVVATYTPPPLYALNVVNGSGDGNYVAGAVVNIAADPPPPGQIFSLWTGATVADSMDSTTTITIGAANVTVTATYVPAPGPLRYVATTGDDGNDGSLGSPWQTITYGASQITAGYTLYVRGGTYDENLPTCNSGTGTSWADASVVRIAAYPGETVWMIPSSGPAVVQFGADESYIEFDGINMDGTHISSMTFLLFPGDPNHIRIQNAELIGSPNAGGCATICGGRACQIINNVIHGGGIGGGCGPLCANLGWYSGAPDNLVDGNEIYDTSEAGIQIYAPGGGANNNIIRNNIIHNVTRGGYNNPGATIVGILVASGDGNQVYNNVVYNCGVPAGSSTNAGINVFGAGCTNTLVFDNTLYGNFQYGISIQNSVGTILRNNICYGNANDTPFDSGTGTVQDHNLFGVNPLFVNAAGGDFRVQAGSPAISAGIGIPGISTDITGLFRPTSGACTIGAYEFAP